MKRSSTIGALIFSSLLFLGKAFFVATATLRGIGATTWIYDDSFIVMRVARNLALGHGFTYDGIHATTGSPPLWTFVTSINHMLFPLEWAVKSTIIEMALFGTLTSLLVFFITRKLSGSEVASWVALILATLTGNIFFQMMNGMETSMFSFGVILTVALWLGVGKPQNIGEKTWMMIIGSSAGLTSMIRGDGIFLIAALVIVALLEIKSASPFERRSKIKELISLIGSWLFFFAVLTLWQLARTGSPLLGNQVGRHELALALHGFSFEDFDLKRYLTIVGWNVFQLLELLSIALGTWLLLPLSVAYGLGQSETKKLSLFTLVYCVFFFGALIGYQWYFPDLHGLRYIVPASSLVFILTGILFVKILQGPWSKVSLGVLTLAILLVSQYQFYGLTTHLSWAKNLSLTMRPTAEQEEKTWAPIDWAKKNIKPGTVVAVRDHGRFAFFTDLPVQDLAGTVDPIVPTLVKNGGLKEYLKSRNVEYVYAPPPGTRGDLVYQALFRDLKLTPVKEAPLYGGAQLYRVKW